MQDREAREPATRSTGVPTSAQPDETPLGTSREQIAANFEKRRGKWYLDVKNTPCARDSLIHGILGGLGAGLLYYLKSNVVMRSCDLAVIGFVVTAYGSWRYCRYEMMKQHRAIMNTVEKMNEIAEERQSNGNSQVPPAEERT